MTIRKGVFERKKSWKIFHSDIFFKFDFKDDRPKSENSAELILTISEFLNNF